MKKNKFTLTEAKKLLLKKGLLIVSKKRNIFFIGGLKSVYLSFASGLIFIALFFIMPFLTEINKNYQTSSKEIKNNSKSNFEKVLIGEDIKKTSKIDEELDIKNLFDDIFQFDQLPNDIVRLSASTIEQLFKDTNYNLKNVRETKLVKPISLTLLPEEIKKIEDTKRRKDLFIQIILPLIIDENNKIKIDRKKLFSILNKNHNTNNEKKWLSLKFKQYGVLNRDLSTLKVRMDEVPVSLAIAQAAKETGWGSSRFALEGNALFGQWTWSGEGIKPAAADSDSTHKIMKFKILQASVKAYQRNLNTHSSYKNFRMARAELRDEERKLDSLLLANFLDKYAETGSNYVKILKQIIEQNKLTDFDDAKLLPSSIELQSLI
jgi:Bax protein